MVLHGVDDLFDLVVGGIATHNNHHGIFSCLNKEV